MRLIDADELIEKADCLFKDLNSTEDYMGIGYNHGVGDGIAIIKNAPTIEAERIISETTALRADEFAEKMREALQRYGDDEEIVHIIGDGLMCDLLRELGYSKGVDIFEDMPRWYA